ncbi:uncharacterized protein LOC116238867 [Phasianus colchicus]|uniref:uncharacterized protein LOC116238867 n=1 Tax=Phasianus colchicus TaxID=9054 RepID=UPI00129EDDDD|nr:uncharacterized protein LOC116238867 [Phasianus colchicus]
MSDSIATKKSEDVLFDLLEKHGARPSLSGVDWARQNWYNLQSVSDRIRILQNEARTRAGNGKSFICAALRAALKAAVEFREEKHSAETQTIQALQESVKVTQELVKTLQNQIVNLEEQLEREKHNSALLQTAFKELLTSKHADNTVTHKRGDPLAIIGTVDQLEESVQKAACLQMMYDRKLQPNHESPMMMPVDPERMTALIRGLPESLKPIGIQLQGKIQVMPQGERARAALEGTVTPNHLQSGFKVWTWGEVAQELINYGRKCGPVVSSSSKFEPRGIRLAAVSLAPRPPSPKLSGTGRVSLPVKTGRRNIDHKRHCLWTLGWLKGVPRDLMNGLATVKLEKLVNWWPEEKLRDLEESKTPGPGASPREPEWKLP